MKTKFKKIKKYSEKEIELLIKHNLELWKKRKEEETKQIKEMLKNKNFINSQNYVTWKYDIFNVRETFNFLEEKIVMFSSVFLISFILLFWLISMRVYLFLLLIWTPILIHLFVTKKNYLLFFIRKNYKLFKVNNNWKKYFVINKKNKEIIYRKFYY